jgi:RNA polymerase sigma-70 factor (ECF subfamily)
MTNEQTPQSFDELAAQNRGALVRYLGRLVGDGDAEDVAQIALAKAASAMDSFRGEASAKNWLFRIATNAALDWLRSRGEEPLPLPGTDEEADAGAVAPGEDASQERRLLRQEMSTCVRGVLQRLPEGHRTILALSDCDELSDRDVAAVLGLTVGAAKIRLHRARARLKVELERECTFYRDPENVLCCDKKDAPEENDLAPKNSSSDPYLPAPGLRHQVDGRTDRGPTENANKELDMINETLTTKQKHLIGVGAAVAAGCQPCTSSFVAAAREAGACERGARHALEAGLRGRDAANTAMRTFADQGFPKPDLDEAFRAERKMLDALIGVAAALAANSASVVAGRVAEARKLGATDDQIRMAGQIALTARRGAEQSADAAFAKAIGDGAKTGCCEAGQDCATGGCGEAPAEKAASPCGCSEPAEKTASPCGCGQAAQP